MTTWAQDIRERTTAVLLAAGTIAGARVHPERVEPHYISAAKAAEKLPLLCSYVAKEVSETTGTPSLIDTKGTFVVGVLATGDTDLEAAGARDTLVGQAKRALLSDQPWCDTIGTIEKVSVERVHFVDQREILFSVARLVFDVSFKERVEAEEELAPFTGVDMTFDVKPTDDTIELAVTANVEP